MHFFHKWTKWKLTEKHFQIRRPDVNDGKPFSGIEEWQIRECEVCGLKEERRMRSGYH